MMTDRFSFRIAACVVLLVLSLSGCAFDTAELGNGIPDGGSAEEMIYQLSGADLNTDMENSQDIEFGGEDIYRITAAGTYRLTGSQSGQIYIDVDDEIVHLIIENAFLQTFNGPAVYVKSAAKVVITVPDATRSVISDSTNYADYSYAEACIFSNCDLTFNGKGQLQVTGYKRDAIRSKDTLKILDTDLEVRSRKDGLRGNDGVIVENAKLDLQCEGNGIYTKENRKGGIGFVCINGGTVSVIAGEYGIRSSQNIYLKDSSVNIYGVMDDYYCMGEMFTQED